MRTVSRAQVRQLVNARDLGRWRSYTQELEPVLAEFAAASLTLPD